MQVPGVDAHVGDHIPKFIASRNERLKELTLFIGIKENWRSRQQLFGILQQPRFVRQNAFVLDVSPQVAG